MKLASAIRSLPALGLVLAFAAHAQQACAPSPADRDWAESALRHWRIVEREALKLAPAPFPKVVTLDAQCTAVATETAAGSFAWQGTPHAGTAHLPDGKTVTVGPVSFAAPDPADQGTAYFVMSLPSVWRAKGVKSGLGLEVLMEGVLLHEMAHTRQFQAAQPMLERLTAQYGLPDDISDDSLQETYATNPEYVRDYEAERDLLFAAAAAPTDTQARALAGQALARMKARRAHWFTGPDEKWLGLDDVFLTMEGLGQWVAYWWFTSPQGLKLDPATAQRELRRGGKHWTQDEGLALFLVIDRLVPGWQSRAFGAQPAMAQALLEAAAGGR
jgi:hypothetical protein